MKSKKRKVLIIVIIVTVLILAIVAGCWFFFFGSAAAEPVNVYSFNYIGMTEYWGDQQESYGPVTTDNIQTVFLSSTQTVTEILVSPGDAVKKGDLLMRFDTTLTDIALERERLRVEKLKLDLEDAQEELQRINNMRPSVIPPTTPSEPEEEDPGTLLEGPYAVSPGNTYDGSTQDLALICWMAADTPVDDALLDVLRQAAGQYQQAGSAPVEPDEPIPEETVPTDPTESIEASDPTNVTEPTTEETEPPTEPIHPVTLPDSFYVVLKITEGNLSNGFTKLWQGVHVTRNAAGAYQLRFFDASAFADHTIPTPELPETPDPEPDYGSGFTSAEIAKMRAQQEKAIRDLQFQIKMAESEYKIMQREMGDGNIYAEIDGTVVSVLDPEMALMNMEPVMKVSSGGGYYVEGSISELMLDQLQIGQTVDVNDWNTGMVYTGTVVSVDSAPLPDDGGFYGNGNPNVSLYPFTVFIDESADLQAGTYVSVMYSTATAQSGIYLENPFIRTEQGKSYVYVQGADGLLEKRYVTTGKSLWGSYTEILDGLTPEDLIAFPYGKHVKPGAPAVESDISTLYEY